MSDLQVSIQFIIQQAAEAQSAIDTMLTNLQTAGATQLKIAQDVVTGEEKANEQRMASDAKLLISRIAVYNKLEETYRKANKALQDQTAREIQASIDSEARAQKEAAAIQASMDKAVSARKAADDKKVAVDQAAWERGLALQISADNRMQAENARVYQQMLKDEASAAAIRNQEGGGGFLASLSKSLIGLTLMRQAIRKLEAVAREAFGNFTQFEDHMARIAAVVPLSAEETDNFSRSLLNLSTRLPVAINDMASAAEAYVRAGGDIKNANAFVEQSGKLAVATQSSMKASTELIIDTMKNYGLSMEHQGEVTDFFTKLSMKSRTNIDELQNSFGRLTIVASNSGVSLEELGSAFSQLRESGLTTQQSTVALEQAVQRLQDPVAAIRDQLKHWGVDAKTLTGRLQQLKDAHLTEGDLLEIFGSRTGLRAVQPLLNGIDEMKQKQVELRNAAGATGEAFAVQSETVSSKIQVMKNSWQGFTDQALSTLSIVLKPLFDILGAIARALESLPRAAQGIITGLGLMEVAGYGVVLMLKTLGVTITTSLGPLGLIFAAVGLLAGGLLTLAGAEERETLARNQQIQATVSQAKSTHDLIDNYKEMESRVEKAKKGSEDETNAKKALKLAQDKLIEVHPELKGTIDDETKSLEAKLKVLQAINAEEDKKVERNKQDLQKKRDELQQQLKNQEAKLASAGSGDIGGEMGHRVSANLLGMKENIENTKNSLKELDTEIAKVTTDQDLMSGKAKEAGADTPGTGKGGDSTKEKTKQLTTEIERHIRVLQDELEIEKAGGKQNELEVKQKELLVQALREVDRSDKDFHEKRITRAEHDKEVQGHWTAYTMASNRLEEADKARSATVITKIVAELDARENESFGKRRSADEAFYTHRIDALKAAGASEAVIRKAEQQKVIAEQQESDKERIQSAGIFQKKMKEIEQDRGSNLSLEEQIALVQQLGQQGTITAAAVDQLTKRLEKQRDAAAGWSAGWKDAMAKNQNAFKYMHDEAIKMMGGIESSMDKMAKNMILTSGSMSDKLKAGFKDLAASVIGQLADMGIHQMLYGSIHTKQTETQIKESTAANTTEATGNKVVAISAVAASGATGAKTISMAASAIGAQADTTAMLELTTANDTMAVSAQMAAGATYFSTYSGIPFVGPFLAAAAVAAMELEMGALMTSASSIVGFADGAIVNKPTLAMVGEGNEPEAIVPKSALKSFMDDISRTSSWAKNPAAAPTDPAFQAAGAGASGGSGAPLVLQVQLHGGTFMDTSRRGKSEFIDFLTEASAHALSGRIGKKVVGQGMAVGQ